MTSTSDWSVVAQASARFLEHHDLSLPTSDTSLQLSPLHLPPSLDQTRTELEHLGCSDRTVNLLVHAFCTAFEKLSATFQRCFLETMQGTAPTLDQESLPVYEQAIRSRYETNHGMCVEQLRTEMLEEVRLYQSRLPKETMARHGTGYTTTITDILYAVFHQKDKISMAEKRRLASVTGLTENQVAVWFTNQRARSKDGPAPVRRVIAPYPAQRSNPPAPRPQRRRHVSTSSVSSVSSTSSAGSDASYNPGLGLSLPQWVPLKPASSLVVTIPASTSRFTTVVPRYEHSTFDSPSPSHSAVSYSPSDDESSFFEFCMTEDSLPPSEAEDEEMEMAYTPMPNFTLHPTIPTPTTTSHFRSMSDPTLTFSSAPLVSPTAYTQQQPTYTQAPFLTSMDLGAAFGAGGYWTGLMESVEQEEVEVELAMEEWKKAMWNMEVEMQEFGGVYH